LDQWLIDTDHAGAMGYSFDGLVALAMSGARVDPEFYLAQCAQPPTMDPAPPDWYIPIMCDMTAKWDEIAAYAGEAIAASEDGLWQAMTDERIRAVIPMAPDGILLFGERGLAAVDRPTLIIVGTADEEYELESVNIFKRMGTPDRAMISFVGKGHAAMVQKPELVARMQHFIVAFFGYHLKGRQDYAAYFSEDFVAQYDDLAWGVYTGP
jgi:predicted dienelactone hydrolase